MDPNETAEITPAMVRMVSAMTRDKDKEDRASYLHPAEAMLAAATFAGSITFTVLLAPRDGAGPIPGINELAYASSLFLGSMMGCILIIASIELEKPINLIQVEAVVVGITLFVAFYLMLLASSLFLQYRGPFIVGSILYLSPGLLTLYFVLHRHYRRWTGKRGSTPVVTTC
jgi:hypothetical protein